MFEQSDQTLNFVIPSTVLWIIARNNHQFVQFLRITIANEFAPIFKLIISVKQILRSKSPLVLRETAIRHFHSHYIVMWKRSDRFWPPVTNEYVIGESFIVNGRYCIHSWQAISGLTHRASNCKQTGLYMITLSFMYLLHDFHYNSRAAIVLPVKNRQH